MQDKILLLLLLTFLFSSSLLAQGPIDGFMKKGGEADLAFSYGYEHYENYYLGSELQDTFDRTYHSAALFIAYGFEENLGLVVSIPFVRSDADNKGFQDGQFFLKYRPVNKTRETSQTDFIVAAGVTTSLGNYRVSPESNNPIGEKPTVFEFRGVLQHQEYSGIFFMLKSGASYKIRPRNQFIIPTVGRVGYGNAKFYTDFWIDFTYTIGAGDNEVPLGQEGSTFLKFGGTLYFPIGKSFGVFANAAYTPWGRNIGRSPRLGAGFVLKLQGGNR